MKDRENFPQIINLNIVDNDQQIERGYCPQGTSEFDKFVREQREFLEMRRERLNKLVERGIGYRHGFRSIPEMNKILTNRENEINKIGVIISVLDGRNNHPLRYRKDKDGNVCGFELG